jgi:putative transposase
MSNYLRDKTPGAYYFFTLVTFKRRLIFANEEAFRLFRKTILKVKKEFSFHLEAIVVLPDHTHLLIRLPEDDYGYSKRIAKIKKYFGDEYNDGSQPQSLSNAGRARHERAIWQRRFWEHRIRNQDDLEKHIHYIHYNPIKHGYVTNVADWKWSSYHSFQKKGFYDKDWCNTEPKIIIGAEWD